jgi:copper transport protein
VRVLRELVRPRDRPIKRTNTEVEETLVTAGQTASFVRRHRPALRRSLVVLVLGFAWVAAGPARPAAAHAQLISTSPSAGDSLDESPDEIVVTFNETVELGLGAIRVFDGNGDEIDIGGTSYVPGDDHSITASVPPLADGSYVVDWRAVSADSHPLHSAFIFQVGATATLQPGVVERLAEQSQSRSGVKFALGVTRVLVPGGLALVVGALWCFAAGVVPWTRRVRALGYVGAAVGCVAGLSSLPLEAALATGRGFGTITDPDAWRAVAETSIGTAWLIRALVIGVVGGGACALAAWNRHGWWRAMTIVGLAVVSIASAYGGHGSTGRWISIGVGATALHVAAMAVWVGGLTVVASSFGTVTYEGFHRFSSVAFVAAPVVVATGVLQAVRQVGSLDELTSSEYGRLVLAKSALVLGVLALAALGRRAVHGRLFAGVSATPLAVGSDVDVDRRTLRRSLVAEVLLVALTLGVTGVLTGANPTAAAAAQPFSTTLVEDDFLATVTIDPAKSGVPAELHLYLSSPQGSLVEPDEVTVSISDTSRDVAAIDVPMTDSGASHYQALGFSIPYPGRWTLQIDARYGEFDVVSFTTDFTAS